MDNQINMYRKKLAPILIFIFSMAFISCQEDDDDNQMSNSPQYTHYEVSMTDAPGNFSEVNIEVKEVRVQNSVNGWVTLNTHSGVYNLLDFNNGIDTLLASDSIPSGRVNQIRLVLGDSNTVVVDGVEHDLTVPSGSESGLKLGVHQTLAPNITYTVLLDFDVAQSVILTGSGNYILKPVIKVVAEGTDGAIKGDLNPDGVYANIFAVKNGDTTGGTPDSAGNFIINGLDSGKYQVIIDPAMPYLKDTLSADVSLSQITDLGSIQLQQ